MGKKVIQIPTLNDSASDFYQLFDIWRQVNALGLDVIFDFSECHFLRPNAVAFLGGLARLIEFRLGRASFDWSTLNDSWVRTTIRQNGFAYSFGDSKAPWDGTSIPYRENQILNMTEIMDYLTYQWIGNERIHVSGRLQNAIVGNMWEIYNNAFEHSDSDIGVFSCGQYFPNKKILLLSIVDFGHGIPAKIRGFFSQRVADKRVAQLTDASCLQWAFKAGTTTKVDEPGGSGLGLLKEFIRLNQGKLEIYSNKGYAIIDKEGERYREHSSSFEGTFVHVTVHCDEKLYKFLNEPEPPY